MSGEMTASLAADVGYARVCPKIQLICSGAWGT